MLSESHYWMFGNALLLMLDIEAMVILGLHLWFRRREFTFAKHGVSLAVFIYVLGHVIFRAITWELWREVSRAANINDVARDVMWLFNQPVIKATSLLNIIGLIMITMVLTWEVKTLWIYATSLAIILALVSTLLS